MINKAPANYADHIASPLNKFMRTDLIRAKQSRLSKKCDIFATLIVIHHRLLQSLHFRKKTGFCTQTSSRNCTKMQLHILENWAFSPGFLT